MIADLIKDLKGARIASASNLRILVFAGIVVLALVRVIAVNAVPLAFDEAYYWLWSKHLAGGYFDHPPMVAVIVRLGTLIAGDTQLGVRLIGVLLAVPATGAVWRSAQLLFKNGRLALTSAVLFNLTLAVAVGTAIATPDCPLIAASAFVLFFTRPNCWTATTASGGSLSVPPSERRSYPNCRRCFWALVFWLGC